MTTMTLTNAYAAFFEDNKWVVAGADAEGREYTLLADNGIRLMSFDGAQHVVVKIKQAGLRINTSFWSVRAPYGTEAWLIDGMEERQIEDERFGYY